MTGSIGKSEPFVIDVDDLPPASAASPAVALPPPDDPPHDAGLEQALVLAAGTRSRGGRWFWGALGGLVSLMVSVAAYDFVAGLIARSPALGTLALLLTCVLAIFVVGQLLREVFAMRRLTRIDGFRAEAAAVRGTADRAAALALSERLDRFFGDRPELRWGRQTLLEQRAGVLDPDAILDLTERALFEGLDQAARREIEAAARTVAAATALIPLALADVLAALSMNIRMVRRIAETYGARAGLLGSWRVLSTVAQHLLATGALAVGDDMIGSIAGGGALARVSRRFGEGVLNGALTARVGVAAMEVCRPLPFIALPRPKVSNLVQRALTGLFAKS